MRIARVSTLALVFLAGCGSCGRAPSEPSVDAGVAPYAATRSPAQIRTAGNHLTGAGSLYLRMHANNPVDWYAWGPEALERAKSLDRPIFLSIGYASCHWCHVMEDEVFSKDDVALYLNDHFVSIKVDREERPDLDAFYIDAVQAMTGSGGWPLTVFLTPERKPFFGGTYFPHDAFLKLTSKVVDELAHSRSELETRGAEVYARISKMPEVSGAERVRSEEILAVAAEAAEATDPTWGGFRGRMKFPNPVRWTFLLDAYRKGGNRTILAPLQRTLDAMASGGIHDQIGGGFHRYTVDTEWVVPHFEKMLYVNAELAMLYLGAASAIGDRRYVEVASDTLDFLLRDMAVEGGGFAASLDADSGGHEGTFYVLTPPELRRIAGEADGTALATFFGATDAGNFEGKNVLTRRSTHDAELAGLFRRWRPKLLEARLARTAPQRDAKVVTSWNGMAISALARGFAATRDVRYRDAATKTAEFLWRVHRKAGALLRVSNEGRAEGHAGLDDHAAFARGLLDVFEVTGDLMALEHAATLVDEANATLASDNGGWYANVAGDGEGARRIDLFDSEEPSGYAAMLGVLTHLAALTGRPPLYATLDRALAAHSGNARAGKMGMAGWLDAALLESGPFYDVVIAGAPDDPRTQAFVTASRSLGAPWTVTTMVGETGPSAEMTVAMPALLGKTGRERGPLAYVCVRGACKLPGSDPQALRAALLAGWAK